MLIFLEYCCICNLNICILQNTLFNNYVLLLVLYLNKKKYILVRKIRIKTYTSPKYKDFHHIQVHFLQGLQASGALQAQVCHLDLWRYLDYHLPQVLQLDQLQRRQRRCSVQQTEFLFDLEQMVQPDRIRKLQFRVRDLQGLFKSFFLVFCLLLE